MFRFISCDAPTLLKQLCRFPFFFFLSDEGKLSLFPTLIAVTFENEQNLAVLGETIDTKLIGKWLRKRIHSVRHQLRRKRPLDRCDRVFVDRVPPRHWARCLELYG